MNDIAKPNGGLKNVFAAASARADQWRHLNAIARAWASAAPRSAQADKLREEARGIIAALARLEHCWAYPGQRLLDAVNEAASESDPATFARLVQRISGAILTGEFRRDEALWDVKGEAEALPLDAM